MQLDPAVAKTRPSNFSPVVLRMFGFTSCAELSNAHKSATKHDRNPTLEIPGPASGIWTTRQHRRSESETHTHTYLHKRAHTHTHTYMCACLSVCPSVRLSAYLSVYLSNCLSIHLSVDLSLSIHIRTYIMYVKKTRCAYLTDRHMPHPQNTSPLCSPEAPSSRHPHPSLSDEPQP